MNTVDIFLFTSLLVVFIILVLIILLSQNKYAYILFTGFIGILLYKVLSLNSLSRQLYKKYNISGGNDTQDLDKIKIISKDIIEKSLNKEEYNKARNRFINEFVDYLRSQSFDGKQTKNNFSRETIIRHINKGVESVKSTYNLSNSYMYQPDEENKIQERKNHLKMITKYMANINYYSDEEYNNELKEQEIELMNSINNLSKNMKDLQTKNKKLESQIEDIELLKQKTFELDNKLSKCRKEQSEESQSCMNQINILMKTIEENKTEKNLLEEKKQNESTLIESQSNLTTQIQLLNDKLNTNIDELAKLSKEKDTLQQDLTKLYEEHNNLLQQNKLLQKDSDECVKIKVMAEQCNKILENTKDRINTIEETIKINMAEKDALSKEISDLQLENKKLSNDLQECQLTNKKIQELELNINDLTEQLNNKSIELQSCITTKDELKIKLDKSKKDLLDSLEKINTLETEISNKNLNIIELNKQIVEKENKNLLNEYKINELGSMNDEVSKMNEELSKTLEDIVSQNAKLQKDIEKNLLDIDELNNSIANNKKEIQQLNIVLELEKEKYNNDYKKWEADKVNYTNQCNNEKNKLQKEIDTQKNTISIITNEKEKVNNELNIVKDNLNLVNQELEKSKQELNKANQELTSTNTTLNEIKNELKKTSEELDYEKNTDPLIIYVDKDTLLPKKVKPIIKVKTKDDIEFEKKLKSLNI